MADTPSSILLTREQSVGSNTNTWGGYLIITQRMTEQASKGYQTLAVTGDATISWTNYTTGNIGSCAFLNLTGTLSASATLTFPGYQNFLAVRNNTGATITIKCSGGTGVSIPNTAAALLYCDGTDYYNAAPTIFSGPITASGGSLSSSGDLAITGAMTLAGQIHGVANPTANTDGANKTYVDTAIATAGLPATAGTVLNSGGDTTAGYLSQKAVASGLIAATTTSPGGAESLSFAVIGYTATGTNTYVISPSPTPSASSSS